MSKRNWIFSILAGVGLLGIVVFIGLGNFMQIESATKKFPDPRPGVIQSERDKEEDLRIILEGSENARTIEIIESIGSVAEEGSREQNESVTEVNEAAEYVLLEELLAEGAAEQAKAQAAIDENAEEALRQAEQAARQAAEQAARQTEQARQVEQAARQTEQARQVEQARQAEQAAEQAARQAEQAAEEASKLDEYIVELGAKDKLEIPGQPGELRVWIGDPAYQSNFPSGLVSRTATVPAVGESAKIEPFAPAFTIEPAGSQCIKIHPSGSEVLFKLTPRESGKFSVSARILLYDSADCNGPPVPKAAATLTVVVLVNNKELVLNKVKELGNILWEKFVDFWTVTVGLMFALVLFLIRGKLKQWFGFEEK